MAYRVLRRVSEGAYADRALIGEAQRAELPPGDRAKAHRLVFGAVQRRRTLDWFVDPDVTNPAAVEPEVRDVLRIGAYELVYSDGVPASAAVDQAVRLAREIPGDARRQKARAGLVNAVLRRLAASVDTRRAALGAATAEDAAVAESVPDWIARRLFEDIGPDAARDTLRAANEPSESVVRWNALKGSREEFEALLPPGARRDELLVDAYILDAPFALERSPIWSQGRGMGQSRASMLPPLILAPQPGERIVDLCAAPGAKTTYLAALAGGDAEIVAVEPRPARSQTLRSLAERMGARITVVEGDARGVALEGSFDAALVDPPCTGLGVLSARPDARWRRNESDVAVLADLQRALLARAISLVRPGGRVVYSTCTLLRAENEDVVREADLALDPADPRFVHLAHPDLPGAIRTLPGRDNTDGFFVARLRVS